MLSDKYDFLSKLEIRTLVNPTTKAPWKSAFRKKSANRFTKSRYLESFLALLHLNIRYQTFSDGCVFQLQEQL